MSESRQRFALVSRVFRLGSGKGSGGTPRPGALKRAGSVGRGGKLRGLGVAHFIEACGIAPSALVGQLGARAGLYESATVRVNATGGLVVMTGSHSHGQGHETTFPQVVAEMIGIDEHPIK